jgi:rod shape-determining protein MreD
VRVAAFILLGYALMVLVSAVGALSPIRLPLPEVGLLVVLYLGLTARGPLPTHVGVALLLGYLTDVLSGAPRGLHALSLAATMLIARGAASRLLVARRWQEVLVTLLASLGHGLVVAALIMSPDGAPSWSAGWGERLAALPGPAIVSAVTAPLFFALALRLDRRLGVTRGPRTLGARGGLGLWRDEAR